MKGSAFAIVMLLLGTMTAGTAIAQSPPGIVVESPWVRATPGGARTGAAYMELLNKGSNPDRLLSATTPAAKSVQFHSVSEENGISRMHEVTAVDVAPGRSVVFRPGGMHMMLVGLSGPLREGGTVRMTLKFEKAGTVQMDLPVGRIGAMHAPGAPDENGSSAHP